MIYVYILNFKLDLGATPAYF